ncbi:hypothetical protein EL26_15995 [Tumebacillus flagellatus]|uniref:Copper amine oxidase-like N-terminal domain-containing protein n=1 Tax=Tumebacillus flagellatus TaxID=1157490 RepID=A0A074LMD6_9BACL|nr:hypothetical protein EL26_15995 [Tumebacillus flagellatus]
MTVDDHMQIYDPAPVLRNGRTMVPLRSLFETLGATVLWEDATRTVTALSYTAKGQIKLTLQVDNPIAYLNGNPLELDQPPTVIDDHTMVPLRLVSESLRAAVDWKENTQTVEIYSLNYQLFLSSLRGNVDLVTKELDLGANPNYRNPDRGDTPLIASVVLKRLDVVQLLLDNGADINAQASDGYSALLAAVSGQDVEMTKLLLKQGANPNLASPKGTALQMARQTQNQAEINLLLAAGATE